MTATGGRVEIVDTTTRDGNQSLWGATGLTARETLAIPVHPELSKAQREHVVASVVEFLRSA